MYQNGDKLCSKGTHDFVLDEEIGLKCLHCSYVAVEIKDISPAMVTSIALGNPRLSCTILLIFFFKFRVLNIFIFRHCAGQVSS